MASLSVQIWSLLVPENQDAKDETSKRVLTIFI